MWTVLALSCDAHVSENANSYNFKNTLTQGLKTDIWLWQFEKHNEFSSDNDNISCSVIHLVLCTPFPPQCFHMRMRTRKRFGLRIMHREYDNELTVTVWVSLVTKDDYAKDGDQDRPEFHIHGGLRDIPKSARKISTICKSTYCKKLFTMFCMEVKSTKSINFATCCPYDDTTKER